MIDVHQIHHALIVSLVISLLLTEVVLQIVEMGTMVLSPLLVMKHIGTVPPVLIYNAKSVPKMDVGNVKMDLTYLALFPQT